MGMRKTYPAEFKAQPVLVIDEAHLLSASMLDIYSEHSVSAMQFGRFADKQRERQQDLDSP